MISKYKNMNENNRTILKNVLGAFIIKGGALILSLFTLPAYIHYFNNDKTLGLWFTLLSVLAWILNFDLGIGNGLRNHLVTAFAQKDTKAAKRYISSAYIFIGVIVILGSAVFAIIFKYINWNSVFNMEEGIVSNNALYVSIVIVFLGIMLQFLLKLINTILYAMQKSSVNNLLALVTSILTFVYVSVASSGNNDQNIITMAIVHALAVALPLLVTTIIIFSTKLKEMRPSFKFFTFAAAKKVMTLGGIFFFVQLAYMVIVNTNEYLITAFTGSENVVDYNIYNKLFTLGGTVFTLALTPIWSATTKAINEKNYKWVKSLYKKLMIFAGIGCACEFAILPLLQFGVNLWLKDAAIKMNYGYGIIFALMGSFLILNGVLSSIANGAGKLKTQAIIFGIGALIKIPLAYLFVYIFGSWIGIVASSAVSMGIYCIVQPIWLNRYLNQMEKLSLCTEEQISL